ncbi:hypothetical protein CGLO_17666 [Colletotrichum gloeosporioides Cg-14]|uniref:Heterokaryon incompatibility domain-containing protein n=1 Tax=Colletotrichum gloeosporioides (strain Cg-14) TaxID=1237896 RepID=T0JKG1_COLGC|nr:hypothetical protein CGLO_17666 [Colletotrichum gloeosporioides Cg-14]
MINWHSSDCRRPDVMFLNDIGAPSCLNCGEVGTIDAASSVSAARKPPETPQRADFKLCWPASLPFVEDVPNKNDSRKRKRTTSPPPFPLDGVIAAGETPAATGSRKDTTAPAKTSLYEPLHARKIRILQLLPGKYHDPICCKIQTVDLKTRPEYEALSYTWADSTGDTSLSQSIYVGDRHDILPITVNCADALRRLRFPHRSRSLWIDAICIDQDNIQERSHQVGIMQYIYATAERVLIYLGEDEEDPNAATCVPWQYQSRENTLELSTDLRKQPYFTRVWVIQEVASARSAWILLGSKGVRWEDFINPPNTGDQDYRAMCIRNYELLKADHPWLQLVVQPKHRDLSELWGLLSATASCQASDPRDKVFALLGLFIGSSDAGLVPDYSISFSQVLSGLTALSFAQYPDLWRQIFAMARPNPLHDMPTWTVDWSTSTDEWLAIMDSKPTASVSLEDSFLDPTKGFARFCKDGTLVVKGVLFTSLMDCSLDKIEAPPGIISGICHEPDFPIREREARLEASRWALKDDKVYAVQGLRHELLVLRPLKSTNKQSFVGICENFSIGFSAGLIKLVDRRRALLFSTWNEVLDHRMEDWFIPQTWNNVVKVLTKINTYQELEKTTPSTDPRIDHLEEGSGGPSKSPWRRQRDFANTITSTSHTPEIAAWKSLLLKFRQDMEEDRHQRVQLRGEYMEPYVEDSYTLRMTSNVPWLQDENEVNLADFLLPECWHHKKFRFSTGFANENWRPNSHGYYESIIPWNPDYMNNDFWRQLGRMLQLKVSCHTSGYESAESFLRRLVGQKLTNKSRDFNALLRYYEAGKSCAPRLTRHEKLANEYESFFRWIRNSMELVPDASWTPGEHSSTAENRSWAENFYDMWETLSWRPRQVSHKPPRPMVFDGNPGEEGVITEDFEEATDAGKWVLERGFEERAWGMLRDLAADTKEYLLPLREEFVKNRGVATCANKTNDMKWEDVYIV